MEAEEIGSFIGRNFISIGLLIGGFYYGYMKLKIKKKRKEVKNNGLVQNDIRN